MTNVIKKSLQKTGDFIVPFVYDKDVTKINLLGRKKKDEEKIT